MAFRCSLVRDGDALARLAPEWRALMAKSDADEPTLSPIWLSAWWRVFGPYDGRRLCALALRDGARLVALVPLCARSHRYRGALPFRRLELLASGEDEADEICSDYIGPIIERGAEEAVAHALTGALTTGGLGAWDELVMPAMNGERAFPSLFADALSRAGAAATLAQTGASPYLALPASWEAYLAALPSSRRYLVTRSLRDWEKWAGEPPQLTRVGRAADLAEGRRVLMALHGERWGKDGESGVFLSSRFAAFHEAVMPPLFAEGALELSWLSARGEPVAVLYNLVWNGKIHFYQSGRAVSLPKQIRPGIVAHACAIRRAIAEGRREYDFLAGDSQYKLQLALATRPLVTLRAVNAPWRERARLAAERAASLVRRMKNRQDAKTPSAPLGQQTPRGE
jgi:CelD/BcsL family acetyltransferase involved in cellulose biosynthesis